MPPGSQWLKRVAYSTPSWASHLRPPEHGRVLLGHLPTPLMPWACPALKDLDVHWSIKRDDISGVELSGNKVRKLEFLMAEALATGCDCVVTIGGLQSNHCRATAAAARYVGLEPHVVLLVKDGKEKQDPGMQGNLLLDRLLGATLHLCSASDYFRYGGDLEAMDKLNNVAANELKAQGLTPYVVPVGGTCPLGTWGYINAIQELREQIETDGRCPFDHVVVAAGSGGTAAGMALGCRLGGIGAQLHAINVQHTPDAYYRLIKNEVEALGATPERDGTAEEWVHIHNGSGAGYAVTSPEQLAFIRDVGAHSGVLLDHVYTGKALYHFCEYARANATEFRGKRILFWHTGGLPGLYAQDKALLNTLPRESVQR
eukprot:CAMPEP_0117476434 /NCGR_PEP_ID=MMETSP0784-20121206/10307_1 /TAXON_ID=39447 /ORGANISM="" /LENGTH=371 /DNA_ID=CAMNT_0005270709 /DNA_START=1 /DNA_END=1113 /DNA_ORIENTATION=-